MLISFFSVALAEVPIGGLFPQAIPHDQGFVEVAGNIGVGSIGARALVSGAVGERLRLDGQVLSLAMLDTNDSLAFGSIRYNVLESEKFTMAPFLMVGGLYNHLGGQAVAMVMPGLAVNYRYKALGLDGSLSPFFWGSDQDMDILSQIVLGGSMSSFGVSAYLGRNQLRAGYDSTSYTFGYRYQGDRFYAGGSVGLTAFILPGVFASVGYLWG